MSQKNISLPATITVQMGKGSTDRLLVDTNRIPANVIEAIFTAGAKVILSNTYNGGGKDMPHKERLAAAQKKLDAWYRGEFNIVNRGDSMMSALREAYVDDVKAKTGATSKQVEDSIRSTVSAVFGEKESATFGRFVDAMGTLIAREKHDGKPSEEQVRTERDAFEATYQKLADEAAKRRADASAKLDLTSLALGAFKKA